MNKMIILIGNKLSSRGLNPTSIEKLSKDLEASYNIKSASDKKNYISRMLDIIKLIINNRKVCELIIVDVFSTRAFYFSALTLLISKFLNIKIIPVFRGGSLPERFDKNPYLFRFIFQRSQLIICPSSYLADFFNKKNFNCKIIHNYIDIRDYPFKIRGKIAPKLFWVRAIHSIYNPIMAIQVLNETLKFAPQAELCMVGPFKDNTIFKLKKLILSYNLDDKVKITGKLSKSEWIKLSMEYDIFINTTNFDNQPVSVIEAMALGLPVVSTNVGGIPDLLINNKTAKLVEKNNVDQMVTAIKEYLLNNTISKIVSANARELVELSFDQTMVIAQWLDIIREFITSKAVIKKNK